MLLLTQSMDRFQQPRFKGFGKFEQLLLKSIRKDGVVDEIETLQANFEDDYDPHSLMPELELLLVICSESQPITLEDVVKVIQSLSNEKCELIRNVVVIIRIVLMNGATPERSFSMLRRLKKWLGFTMTPSNQAIVDEIDVDRRGKRIC